jgi:predicted nucleic-acid-binding Zn-ribbon protein
MALNPLQKQKINHWLSNKPKICPNCGAHAHNEVKDDILVLPAFRSNTISLDHGHAVVVIACKECGYSQLFSAVTLGLVTRTPNEKSESPAGQPEEQRVHTTVT